MTGINVRLANKEEVAKLQCISRQTFLEAFSSVNTEENMKSYLEESFSTEKLNAEFNNTDSEFYFAELGNELVGYLKLNFGESQTELQEDKGLEIERIYVLEEFYGKKIGQLLFEKALEIAGLKNVDYVWLGVWEGNSRAIYFYKKNGFIEFDKHRFMLGNDEQTDIMMKLQLKGGENQ